MTEQRYGAVLEVQSRIAHLPRVALLIAEGGTRYVLTDRMIV
jgi:hypothetical protein